MYTSSGAAARLHRQLARGRQHEHIRGAHFARAEQQPLQQRQRKCGRFAGARHRAAADVAPGQRQRNARRLCQGFCRVLQQCRTKTWSVTRTMQCIGVPGYAPGGAECMAGIREGQRCRSEPVAAVGESLNHHAPKAASQTGNAAGGNWESVHCLDLKSVKGMRYYYGSINALLANSTQ